MFSQPIPSFFSPIIEGQGAGSATVTQLPEDPKLKCTSVNYQPILVPLYHTIISKKKSSVKILVI